MSYSFIFLTCFSIEMSLIFFLVMIDSYFKYICSPPDRVGLNTKILQRLSQDCKFKLCLGCKEFKVSMSYLVRYTQKRTVCIRNIHAFDSIYLPFHLVIWKKVATLK